MNIKKIHHDVIYLFFIFLTSVLTVADLFINVGRSANGDGLIHTVVPTLFAKSILQGNFPVGWIDGFSNYGSPLGTVSQQLTTYITSLFIILFHNPVLGFNIVVFLGVLFSNIFFYIFLRIYFLPLYSFIGVFFFNFTPYRILNMYIRGALPEFFAGVFFPLLLISAHLIIAKKNIYGLFLLTFSITLLTLTHPFMLIIALFLLIPYVLFLLRVDLFNFAKLFKFGFLFFLAILFGILITSYYIFPLVLEIKYFYYGQTSNHLTAGNFLGISNFFFYNYPYFTKLDIFNRGFVVLVGAFESLMFIIGTFYFFNRIMTKKIFKEFSLLDVAIISGFILIFMMISPSNFLYTHISFLSNIQFPWRMLSAFVFIPPIILSYVLENLRIRKVPIFLIILAICVVSFPQLYGKNYTNYPYSFYTFTQNNLNAVVMNTIWSGRSEDYPVETQKYKIVQGKGTIIQSSILNSQRIYQISAQTVLKMVDYTFYFPGWKVFVDGKVVPIQYQDSNYRGVITFNVPRGDHKVRVVYTDTKIREFGKIISIIFAIVFLLLFFLKNKIYTIIYE